MEERGKLEKVALLNRHTDWSLMTPPASRQLLVNRTVGISHDDYVLSLHRHLVSALFGT